MNGILKLIGRVGDAAGFMLLLGGLLIGSNNVHFGAGRVSASRRTALKRPSSSVATRRAGAAA